EKTSVKSILGKIFQSARNPCERRSILYGTTFGKGVSMSENFSSTTGDLGELPSQDTEHGQLWYKDAVFYEIHVRAYSDSNGDGIGDFKGLTSKLSYIRDLGVNCIWLLPF